MTDFSNYRVNPVMAIPPLAKDKREKIYQNVYKKCNKEKSDRPSFAELLRQEQEKLKSST